MTAVSVRELVLRGRSGPVSLGRPTREVVSVLGDPTDRSQIVPILKYGPLELTFTDDRLVLVAYYVGRTETDGRIEFDVPESIPRIENWLGDEGLEFSVEQDLSFDNQYALKVTSSGALVLFDEGKLRSVQLAA